MLSEYKVKYARAILIAAAMYVRLEEEQKINHYMVNKKLPKEVEVKNQMLKNITMVLNEPAMGQAELNAIIAQVSKIVLS